ncbi:hypothetical protein VTO73DRAFT_8184 [Trametes versicolor]
MILHTMQPPTRPYFQPNRHVDNLIAVSCTAPLPLRALHVRVITVESSRAAGHLLSGTASGVLRVRANGSSSGSRQVCVSSTTEDPRTTGTASGNTVDPACTAVFRESHF